MLFSIHIGVIIQMNAGLLLRLLMVIHERNKEV